MGRSKSDAVTYPTIAVDRTLYFAYMSQPDRPKPADLLEFAMSAYLNVESGREIMYKNTLTTVDQLRKIFEQAREREIEIQENIERVKAAERAITIEKVKAYILSYINVNPEISTRYVLHPTEAKDIKENAWILGRVKSTLKDYEKQIGPAVHDLTEDMIDTVFVGEYENIARLKAILLAKKKEEEESDGIHIL